MRRWVGIVVMTGLACLLASDAHAGQLGALVSPGPLATAHAKLEGAANCASCHEAGRKVTVARCLSCHQPIAQRIARKAGVHRNAGDDCVSCHVEHAGRTGEMRRIDVKTFNHAVETGFPLDGRHQSIVRDCAMCHKQRTFLDARPACSSCHTDVHKGSLGQTCTTCHTTSVPFKDADTAFDHSRARFQLTGAHQQVKCVECHSAASSGQFRGVAFESCASCHSSPHRATLAATCTSCHTTTSWTTRSVVHTRTRFPLVGAHAQVACEKCHVSGDFARPIKFDQCSTCHVNVHRDSIKEECSTCHNETSFHVAGPTGAAARFDHKGRTGFPLEGKHAPLTCQQCHKSVSDTAVPLAKKVVDYSGASTACVSCHADQHKGEYGLTCQACHRTTTFDVKGFVHPGRPEFYGGEHAAVACVRCHVPEGRMRPTRVGAAIVSYSPTPPTECRSCHSDVHFGQLGTNCETCHDVNGADFAAVSFSHTRTAFPLTGRHLEIQCIKCHESETTEFPAGHGTATRYSPLASSCVMCHADPHLGQMAGSCETCHSTTTFALPTYTHQGMDDFFRGFHGRYPCQSCHKPETGVFPGGVGTTVRYRVGRTCAACHQGF